MEEIATIGSVFDRGSFEEADQFAEFVKDIEWSLDSTQVSPGSYKLEFETIETPEFSVSRMATQESLSDFFSVPRDTVVMSVARLNLNAMWNGKQLPPTAMGIYLPGVDHWAVLPAGWDGYEITLSERLIRQTGLFPEAFFENRRRLEHASLPLLEPVTGHLIAQLDKFFAFARSGSPGSMPAVPVSDLYDAVIQTMLELVDAGLEDGRKHKLVGARRSDIVRKAADLVEQRLESQISIEDLTQEMKVSARVLNYAFKDSIGISPYQYILARKLHAVRRQLKHTEEPVVEVISRYGFSTPSRFGRQYKQLFGETPAAVRNR